MVSSLLRCLRTTACGRRETTGAVSSGRTVSRGTRAATIASTSVSNEAEHQLRHMSSTLALTDRANGQRQLARGLHALAFNQSEGARE